MVKDVIKLGDVATYINGYAFKPEDRGEVGLPIIRIQDLTGNAYDLGFYDGEYPEKIEINDGDVLISWSASLGVYIWNRGKALLNQHIFKVVFDKVDIDKNYFVYAVRRKIDEMGMKTHGATMKHIVKKDFDATLIPYPSLNKQAEIATNLNKVSRVIEARKQELQLLDDLIKARFVEMFGDPMVNPKDYKIKKYGELFELNAGGTPSKTVPEYWENGTISWIGSNMCQNVILYENDGKYISQHGYEHSSARLFPVDTVLIALVGATIGKTALLKFETSTNQNVLGVRHIVESGYNPMFVFYYTQFLYQKFINIGDGGFNMASKGFVSELPMYDVDLSVQNEFSLFANQVDKLIREQSASGQRKKQTTLLAVSAHSSGLHTGFHQLNQVASD